MWLALALFLLLFSAIGVFAFHATSLLVQAALLAALLIGLAHLFAGRRTI